MSFFKTKKVSFFGLLAFLLASPLTFSGVLEPSWRGSEKTVYAEWESWDARIFPSGDWYFTADRTSFGAGARKSISVQAVQEGYYLGAAAQVFDEYLGRLDVLKVNTAGLYVTLPNFLDGEQYTLVRFEISYIDISASFAGFRVTAMTDAGVLPGYKDALIKPQRLASVREGPWLTEVYEFVIKPSPQWETFYLLFSHYPDYPHLLDAPFIDYFSFDTICVPEPSVLFLLTASFLLTRTRR